MAGFRQATLEDVLFISRLLKEFYAKKGAVYGIPLDYSSTIRTVEGVVQVGICLVGQSSCAGAVLVPFMFNGNVLVAHVAFWYFKAPREIEIFEALMEKCTEAGATHVSVASHFPENRIGRHYDKFGLSPRESNYMGRIALAKKRVEP